jgi:hypothetical protein
MPGSRNCEPLDFLWKKMYKKEFIIMVAAAAGSACGSTTIIIAWKI